MERLIFATPQAWEETEGFGCATLRFANTEDSVAAYEKPLEGTVLTGTYETILAQSKQLENVRCAVVVFGNAGGENQFMADLQAIHPCPMVGGGSAFSEQPGLIPGRGEAAVFFVQDDRYHYETETYCIHEDVLDTCHLQLEDPRRILKINGQAAKAYLKEKKAALGLPETDFEHLTLTDHLGINAHLSCVDSVIKSGRDLEETMTLRHVPHEVVYDRIRSFYDDPDAIIFGCAGLGGLLDQPLHTKNLGLFLFGEVCTVKGEAQFGNLMLSKLRILEKD